MVRRCVDIVELLAVAGSGQAVAALVDAQVRRLDADAVDRLRVAGVAVVGVTAPGTDADLERLQDAGISFFVPSNATVDVFAAVLKAAVADRSASPDRRDGHAFADPACATGTLAGQSAHLSSTSPGIRATVGAGGLREPAAPPRGKVIAVWGPTGAPGRTTTAGTLADELGRLGQPSLLIDADVYGGVVAAMFGLLDESAGLVAACRQAQSRRLDAEGLAGLCWQVNAGLRVLTGISRADRWPELRSTALQGVLTVARHLGRIHRDRCRLRPGDRRGAELRHHGTAPQRGDADGAGRGRPDPGGGLGGSDRDAAAGAGLGELRAAAIDTPTWIVLNRVRRSAVGGKPEVELDAALRRFVGQSYTALLPYDLLGLDQAAVAGQTLAEAVPASPLRAPSSSLAEAICGVTAPRTGRRHP